MPQIAGAVKRALLGRPVASGQSGAAAAPKRGQRLAIVADTLGRRAAVLGGACLVSEYLVMAAVATAAGIACLAQVIPLIEAHKVLTGVIAVTVVMLLSLRGGRGNRVATILARIAFVVVIGIVAAGQVTPLPSVRDLADDAREAAPVAFGVAAVVMALILLIAASAAFTGFPTLGAFLARDRLLPKQLYRRGDRMVNSNGIMLLAIVSIIFLLAYRGRATELIELYLLAVLASLPVTRLGMFRYWGAQMRLVRSQAQRRKVLALRAGNIIAFVVATAALLGLLVLGFGDGVWVAPLMTGFMYALMRAVRRHYDAVALEVAAGEDPAQARALPSRVRAIVLVSQLHRAALRAIAYARATRPSFLEVITVEVEPDDVRQLQDDWRRLEIPVPLTVLASPHREVSRPVVDFVRQVRRTYPHDLVVVYVPEYVVAHWWQQILHNQTALRLKSRLLYTEGVVVASVPWRLGLNSQAGTQ